MIDPDLLAAYRATTWTVAMPGGEEIVRLTASSLPLQSFGIITAYNPASVAHSEEENESANRRLRDELELARADISPALALGSGPDAERWTEPGFAVRRLGRGPLIAVGRQYGQNAIVWIDARGRPSLVVTRPGFAGRAVGEIL